MNFAPAVDTTLLNNILATNISAVGVATSPGVDFIASNNKSCAVLFLFLWPIGANELSVSDIFSSVFGNVFVFHELDCVSWILYPSAYSICKASEFVG